MTAEQIDAMVASIPEDASASDRADIMALAADLRDPEIGEEVEQLYRLAIAAGSWQAFVDSLPGGDEPKTARSGNFGHAGRKGQVGGSAPKGDTFLSSAKDALDEVTAGRPATIAKEDLRAFLKVAAAKGGTPDLVKLTLEGTPLFAGGLNIARKDMPQISKEERPNLLAELKAKGIQIREEAVSPMSLLPIQKEINAARVGLMLEKLEANHKPMNQVLISSDSKVLDGHHKWATAVALQTENPNVKMNVIRIGVNHLHALDLLNAYTKAHGIAPQVLQAVDDDE